MLLHAKRRNLGEGCRLHPADPPGQLAWAAPMLDRDLARRVDFDGIGAQYVDDHFEIARIANLQHRRAGLHDGLAFLRDFEDDA